MQITISRPILLLSILLLGHLASAQQARLLWYKGKKLSDTSLQLPNGQRVTYQRSRGQVRVSGGTGNRHAITSRLANREQFKKQVVTVITQAKGGSRNMDLAVRATEAIDEVDRKVEETMGSGELELGPITEDRVVSHHVHTWVQQYHDEVVNYVVREKARDGDKENEIPDPPPMAHFDYCYPCDKKRQEKYEEESADYTDKFFKDHASMISKALKVIQYFDHQQIEGARHDSTTVHAMQDRMKADMEYLMSDLAKKVMRAWNKYKGNGRYIPLLVTTVLACLRQFDLLGMPLPAGFPGPGALNTELLSVLAKSYSDAVMKRDYPVLLNVSWYTGLLRQSSLLGGDSDAANHLTNFLQTNLFEMEIDAEGRIGSTAQLISARMTGTNTYRAVPDKDDCKLRWHLMEGNGNFMRFHLDKATYEGAPITYTGTRDWWSQPADIRLGFCEKPVRDSMLVQTFQPSGQETWVMNGHTTPGSFVASVYASAFMDEKRIRAAAADKAGHERMKKELMEEHRKAIEGNEALLAKDPATLTEAEREKVAEMVAATKNMQQTMMASATTATVLFTKPLANSLKTVFDEVIDGKQLFPRNTAIQHALFKVRIIHVE